MPFAALIDQRGSLAPKPKAAPYNPTPEPTPTFTPVGAPGSDMPSPETIAKGYTSPSWTEQVMSRAPAQPQSPYTTDPGYQQALGAEQLGVSQLDAALKAAQERAVIDFGDPALAGMAGFGLDPQAAAFAKQNYLSGNAQLSRLDKAKDAARKAVIDRLASHGILQSGDLGYGLGEADTQYGNQVYDSRQKVLDYLNGLAQQTLGSKRDLRSQVVAALQGAYQNYTEHPEFYPTGGPQIPKPDATLVDRATHPGESAATRALRLRSEALNRLYGIG